LYTTGKDAKIMNEKKVRIWKEVLTTYLKLFEVLVIRLPNIQNSISVLR
jgi:hypothetical protein